MVEKRVGAGGCDPTIGNGTDRARGRAGLKIADPRSPWRLTETHRARWASDLGEAEWTEPSKQATDYTRPSRPGPLLQRMLSPRAHSESPSWEGSRAGGQSLELRPGVWPQFPSPSRLTATPLVGENPVTCPMGLRPGLGHPPALPGGDNPPFVLWSHCLQSSRLPARGQKRVSRGISQWAGRQTSCRRAGSPPGLARPQGGGAHDALETAVTGVAFLNRVTGLRGPTQELVREEAVQSQKLTSVGSILPGSGTAHHRASRTLVCFSQPA